MQVVGSIVEEQGIRFAVLQVPAYRVESQQEAEEAIASYARLFPSLPVVLMAVGGAAGTTYWGRQDLASFMARQPPASITWQKFSFAGA